MDDRRRGGSGLPRRPETGRRLPGQGCRLLQRVPAFVRGWVEGFDDKDYEYRPLPQPPEAIERMLETMRWMVAGSEQRHLVDARKHYEWSSSAAASGATARRPGGGGRRRCRSLSII